MAGRHGALVKPLSRRTFIKAAGGAGAGLMLFGFLPDGRAQALAQVTDDTIEPAAIPKYVTPLLIPPVMPRADTIRSRGERPTDYYEISVRQIQQQILPVGMPPTTVWGYGAVRAQGKKGVLLHHAPSLTIEARRNRPVRVKWINDLVDADGHFLPHLLPVDPTLHWANPPGGTASRDSRPTFTETPGPYTGPVPLVTHVHGAVGVGDESDGYAEAWFLPAAADIPAGFATVGTWYDYFSAKAAASFGTTWGPGFAIFQYPNDDRAGTKWYHDHSLGLTRLNVYAGPAGFYIIRGGRDGDGAVLDNRSGTVAVLPGPAPKEGDHSPAHKTYYEIPIAIQDRSFNADGSLFYPDSRAFFDGIVHDYIPEGQFSPIWNPEFFGDTIMVNGSTWPFLSIEQRRYRFRFLNGCQSRFLILDFNQIPGVDAWVIGNEGGFLAAPISLTAAAGGRLVMGLAERFDVIVDFTNVPLGNHILANVGPDEPYGGGVPGTDFDVADADTTGQIMQFRVVPARAPDPTTPPQFLRLPAPAPLPDELTTRRLALLEKADIGTDEEGEEIEGPVEALLGVITEQGFAAERHWEDEITENPGVGDTEVWEIYNLTGDAHPIHIHEVAFEVRNRQGLVLDQEGEVVQPVQLAGHEMKPEPWETGVKDTVVALPGQVTRIKIRFPSPGQFVWHCHIVEHEDNEMMRPYRIGPVQPGQPAS
jgi:spore coat protein A